MEAALACAAGPGVGEPRPNDGSNRGPGARCKGDNCVAEPEGSVTLAGACERDSTSVEVVLVAH